MLLARGAYNPFGDVTSDRKGSRYLGLVADECIRNRTDTPAHVELAERADHRPRELSGGEQQRVVIERELINKPNILFADNSTANLDSASSRQILELFRALNRDTLADDHDGDARAPRTLTSGPG